MNLPSRLSIIIPCLNEAAGIAATLAQLQPLRGRGAEVIVADGGSDDGSAGLAAPLADRVVAAPRGRASQMNAGADVARGDVLLFLHADCRLPENADRLVLDGLAAGAKQWGRFDVTLASANPLLKTVARMMNLRSRWSGIATGDQGIFMTRGLFEKIGRFPLVPLMEDIALCKSAKLHGAPLCLHERIAASPRRWEKHGVLRTIILMWRLRLAYFLGADPAGLALRYNAPAAPVTRVLVFARAPEPGAAKTRLIPLLGADGAAALQNLLIERTLGTAIEAAVGRVELWCAPSAQHPLFAPCLKRYGVEGVTQCEGDLGARMQHAAASTLATVSRVLIIGTDCPALTVANLRAAAVALDAQHDAVLIPAEDGGYVLLGLTSWDARLFIDIAWGGDQVLATTRARLAALNWRWLELPPSWDVDRPADFARLRASGLLPGLDQLLARPPRH